MPGWEQIFFYRQGHLNTSNNLYRWHKNSGRTEKSWIQRPDESTAELYLCGIFVYLHVGEGSQMYMWTGVIKYIQHNNPTKSVGRNAATTANQSTGASTVNECMWIIATIKLPASMFDLHLMIDWELSKILHQ